MKIRSTNVQVTDKAPISFNAVLCTVASTNAPTKHKKKENNNFLRWGAVASLNLITNKQ